MAMPRRVCAEALDGLAESDPAAKRSRRDLQRIHRVMGTRRILAQALECLVAPAKGRGRPLRMLELGAGDGSLLMGVARTCPLELPVELTLLDRQDLVSNKTIAAFADCGWTATVQKSDVFDWVKSQQQRAGQIDRTPPWDVIVCNLFLHHFEGDALRSLLTAIESSTRAFLACEPHRGRMALGASHMVGLIGANAVTREDAVLSVHAGFRDTELGSLWPGLRAEWSCKEYSAGLFSHCLCCSRL